MGVYRSPRLVIRSWWLSGCVVGCGDTLKEMPRRASWTIVALAAAFGVAAAGGANHEHLGIARPSGDSVLDAARARRHRQAERVAREGECHARSSIRRRAAISHRCSKRSTSPSHRRRSCSPRTACSATTSAKPRRERSISTTPWRLAGRRARIPLRRLPSIARRAFSSTPCASSARRSRNLPAAATACNAIFCLQTHGVPGVLTMSVLPFSDNQNEYAQGWGMDHRTPIEDRWGGWYVTGTQVPAKHLGNVPVLHVPRSYVRADGSAEAGDGQARPSIRRRTSHRTATSSR